MAAFADLMRGGRSDDRFESNVERHRVNGQWVLAFAFQYIDCDYEPGGLAVHLISEEMFSRAVTLARSRRSGSAADVAAELHGVIEAEEGDERVEAALS